MAQFKSILYATRGVAGDAESLKQALSLARNNAAALQVVVFCPSLPPSLTEYQRGHEAGLAERARADIAEAQAALRLDSDDLQINVEVEFGDAPAAQILQRIADNGHDLLIKQAEDPERRLGFRALDMHLLRQCPCPVWLSRPISRTRRDIRVAVAVDALSAEDSSGGLALELLRCARDLADTCNQNLHILSCWDFELEHHLRHSPWIKMPEEEIANKVRAADQEHMRAVESLLAEADMRGASDVHRSKGRPEQEIPRLVTDLEIDILVMGTVGRANFLGLTMGNTAENILAALECSLLALKPKTSASSGRRHRRG